MLRNIEKGRKTFRPVIARFGRRRNVAGMSTQTGHREHAEHRAAETLHRILVGIERNGQEPSTAASLRLLLAINGAGRHPTAPVGKLTDAWLNATTPTSQPDTLLTRDHRHNLLVAWMAASSNRPSVGRHANRHPKHR